MMEIGIFTIKMAERTNETNTYPNYLQQAPVGRNVTMGEMIDKTVYQGVDRPICQQDGRMSYERNTYQNYDDSGYTQNSRLQRQRENGRQSSYNHGFKLPSFDGKEDWKVWISRFEEVADRKILG